MNTFENTGLHTGILKAVQELGFENPTPIQAKSIPHLLTSDQDLLAFAQTGTGKTAAFGLPAIHLTDIEDRSTQTLVLCPTRELCMQIVKDITNYAKYSPGLGVVAVYGGASMDTQIKALKKGAQIVVATPGRAKDLISRKKLLLGKVVRVVLDEADEMLSMGFKEDLNEILSETPDSKQTLLFSATMSKEVIAITKKYMNNPVEIAATQKNTAAENVKHMYYMVQAKDRYEALKRVADMNPKIYGIVFCRTRRETKEIASKFMQDGYNADALHGELSQAQRDEVMGRFRKGQLQLLIATDVAARGLDVTELTHIINFNLPDDAEIYIHRSGRTGRAGKSGTSISIVHTRESGKIRDIERKFGIKFSKEVVPSGIDICKKQLYSLIDKIEKAEVNEAQIEPFLEVIYKKLEWLSREELIKHFVSAEFNRFLSYYKNARDLNVAERSSRERGRNDGKTRDDRGGRSRREDGRLKTEKRRESFTRLYINAGTKNKLSPTLLIGLINDAIGSGSADIGKIDIMRNFSFFEVENKMHDKVIKSLNGKDFDGEPILIEVSQSSPQETSFKKKKHSKSKDYGGHRRDGRRSGRDVRSSGGGDRRSKGGGDRRSKGGGDRRSKGGDSRKKRKSRD
ncbi:MAG: DEAD/DEAH box helicase [Bacteroidetes bacterium]|nr:DEAD/DEAH box helicase [Bacteroidota bacterium]